MAVVVNELEASVAPAEAGRAEPQGKPAVLPPHELRRQLRRAALRALRVRPS